MNSSLAMAIAKATFECCVRAQEKNRSLHNINLDAVVFQVLAQEQSSTNAPVKYWSSYGVEGTTAHTHQMDLSDLRESNGQIDVWCAGIEGKPDDHIRVVTEIGTNPINGIDRVPSVRISFDYENLAFALFKVGNKIVLNPEYGVRVSAAEDKFEIVQECT
ncbi:hypothetical protein [Diaphorobacter sp. J5-51]|uniref:hypothetical protein n=1 Tax=Diaphorobacter sp. J5-51 TaxID=680496 RepID=UPI0012FC99FC|nr:hypothetical protein [Diaphorobacter sp. J5-51]